MKNAEVRAQPARVVMSIDQHNLDDDLATALRHVTGLRLALERLQTHLRRGSPRPPSPRDEE